MSYNSVPEEIIALPQWVNWEKDPQRGKVPLTINNKAASSIDPKTWSSFDDVCESGVGDGVGYVTTLEDGYVWIDLDDCVGKKWSHAILARCPGYCETSPSGNGYRMCIKATKPGNKCKYYPRNKKDEKIGCIEIYETGRFLTITGKTLPGKEEVGTEEEGQKFLDWLYNTCFNKPKPQKTEQQRGGSEARSNTKNYSPSTITRSPEVSTKKILSVMSSSKSAYKWELLYKDKAKAIKQYGSMSEAVAASLMMLTFYTQNFDQVDTIFRKSALFADKWKEEKWDRLGKEEFDRCIEKHDGFWNPEYKKEDNSQDVYDVHVNLVKELFTDTRRDIFTNDLFVSEEGEAGTTVWHNAFSTYVQNVLKSQCCLRGKEYKATQLEYHMYTYMRSLKPSLLINLPQWDGEDRVAFMCSMLCPGEPGITPAIITDFMKDWGAKMIQKIYTPLLVQNRCPIFNGRQGIGKDVWFMSMMCAFDEYVADLTMSGKYTKESEIASVQTEKGVIFISEFDKTNDINNATMKDMITKPYFTFRKPYDRRPQKYLNRCSFAAACNPENVLRDATGNRRFLQFKLAGGPGEAIKWDYPVMDRDFSLQILAQFVALADAKYTACIENEALMTQKMALYAPINMVEEILEFFDEKIREETTNSNKKLIKGSSKELLQIVGDMSRLFGTPQRDVMKELGANDRRYAGRSGKFYGLPEHVNNASTVLKEQTTADKAQQNKEMNGYFKEMCPSKVFEEEVEDNSEDENDLFYADGTKIPEEPPF